MDQSIEELKLELHKLSRKLDEIRLDDRGDERTEFSDEERREIESILNVQDKIVDQIEFKQKMNQNLKRMSEPTEKPVTHIDTVDKPDTLSGFNSFGEQIKAVIKAGTEGQRVDPRLYTTRAITGMGETIPSDGGFLVAQEYSNDIIGSVFEKVGVLAPRCKRYQVGGNANTLKIPAIDETSRADGSRQGGIRSYWAAEGGTITSSKPKFKQLNFELTKLTALVYLTDELEMDVEALGNWISDRVKDEFAFEIDEAIVNGNGVGMPTGILSSSCIVSVAKETGQAADTIIYDNILKMWRRGIPAIEREGIWIANRDIKSQLYKMSLPVGTAGAPVFLPKGGAAQRPYDTLMGIPIVYSEHAATLGDTGDIILAHMPSYILADKPMKSAYSIHVSFTTDQNVLRFTYRVAGQPAYSSAVTPFKGANTVSPFVKLDAR